MEKYGTSEIVKNKDTGEIKEVTIQEKKELSSKWERQSEEETKVASAILEGN